MTVLHLIILPGLTILSITFTMQAYYTGTTCHASVLPNIKTALVLLYLLLLIIL
jgi:hypothetical protein